MEGKTPVEVYARSWPSPADPPRSLPCRSDGIVSSAQTFPLRLSAHRWSPEEFLQPGEVGAPHYSFAMPLGCRSPPRAPIGSFATPCDLALRLVGGRPAGIATWSAYPSIAAAPINPRIDVMGQLRKKSGGKFATADLLRRLFDATLFPQLTAFVGIGCQSAHDNPGRIRGTAGGPPHPRLHLPWSRLGQQRKLPAPSVKFSRSGPRDQSASPARYAI